MVPPSLDLILRRGVKVSRRRRPTRAPLARTVRAARRSRIVYGMRRVAIMYDCANRANQGPQTGGLGILMVHLPMLRLRRRRLF